MRITDSTMNNTFLNNLNKNMRRMMKAQEQATSGKAVSRPSDNPLLVGKILSMRDNIKQNEQYNRNISDTLGWVQTQDTALDDITGSMQELRDLMIQGANPLTDTDRNAIRDQVESKVGELRDILNTNFDGRYIFGGQKADKPPFILEHPPANPGPGVDETKDKVLIYVGNDENIKREIAEGVTIEISTVGSDITKIDGENLGDFLNEIMTTLETGDTGEFIGKTDKFIDNILRVRSKVGATHNRLEAAEERNTSENINLKGVLSEKEDVDLAESYMNYIMMTTAYQSSLMMGAKILQPSLIDYLR